jgi:DNA-binding NtrC family response regulator
VSNKYPPYPLLIIEDEKDVCDSYLSILADNGITNVLPCLDSRQVIHILRKQRISLFILDLMMPLLSGRELLPVLTREYPEIPVIVVTAAEGIQSIIQCLKKGVYDYVTKPVDVMRLITCVKHALAEYELQKEVQSLHASLLDHTLQYPEAFAAILTNDDAMKQIFRYIEAIAPSPKPVLITGESGTGKELIARAIHRLSGRGGEFVPVNISGLDDTMFSDTLFGHTKGAFTGAVGTRRGLIDKAAGGTIFLDEIGELEFASQVKLLRLLQEKEYYMLGSDVIRTTDTRMIFATNADINEKQKKGEFRKDLYYRLITHHIHLPPLRERTGDIPLLLRHYVGKISTELKKKSPQVPEKLYTLLTRYNFPGNIRELEAMVVNAISTSNSDTLPVRYFCDHITSQVEPETPSTPATDTIVNIITTTGKLPKLKEVETFLIQEALKKTGGNMTAASRLIGISPATMVRRLKIKA